ncbi:MAG: hypothetical protein ACM3O4_04570 [Ignavibacteriales bacterium]
MADEKIEKVISAAAANIDLEYVDSLSKDELNILKDALKTQKHPDSLLYQLVKIYEEKKNKSKGKDVKGAKK